MGREKVSTKVHFSAKKIQSILTLERVHHPLKFVKPQDDVLSLPGMMECRKRRPGIRNCTFCKAKCFVCKHEWIITLQRFISISNSLTQALNITKCRKMICIKLMHKRLFGISNCLSISLLFVRFLRYMAMLSSDLKNICCSNNFGDFSSGFGWFIPFMTTCRLWKRMLTC